MSLPLALTSPARPLTHTAEGEGESSQSAEVPIQLALAEKSSQHSVSTLTHRWWQMPWGGGRAAAMEKEQLAAQRQTHLGCPIMARYWCPAR